MPKTFLTRAERLLMPSHWLWAVPIILLVAAVAIPQVDEFAPYFDEFFTMYTSGWLEGGPFSPAELLDALRRFTPDHMPGHVMLMSLCGSLAGWEIELGRIFSILAGLLLLAVAYRLARDFVAPMAGLMALVMVASTAYFHFYLPYMRMYTLLPLFGGCILWLYLRITHRLRAVRPSDYILLGAAVASVIQMHLFSAVFLLMLGIYHLLFAPKNRRWLWTAAVFVVAVALMLPFILPVTTVVETMADDRAKRSIDGFGALQAWLNAQFNGQPLLLPLALAGLFLGSWRGRLKLKPWLFMPVIYMLLLIALGQATTWIEMAAMHYHLAGWLPFVLLAATGLYGWYRMHRALFLLAFCWTITGLAFHASGEVWRYTPLFPDFHAQPPTQVISRLARQTQPKPLIIGHSLSHLHMLVLEFPGNFYWPEFIDYSQSEHYYERQGLERRLSPAGGDFVERANIDSPTTPALWIYHQSGLADPAELEAVEALALRLGYERCGRQQIGTDTVIDQYMWLALNCTATQPIATYGSDLMRYEFFGAHLDAERARLYFSDRWTAADDAATEPFSMSWQLLTPERVNVAQLDLPLVHGDQLRSFYIDVDGLGTGSYTLAAALYDSATGERQRWSDENGELGALLALTEIELP